jgi:hypothetical protein
MVDTVQVMDVRELSDGMWMVGFEDRAPYRGFPASKSAFSRIGHRNMRRGSCGLN